MARIRIQYILIFCSSSRHWLTFYIFLFPFWRTPAPSSQQPWAEWNVLARCVCASGRRPIFHYFNEPASTAHRPTTNGETFYCTIVHITISVNMLQLRRRLRLLRACVRAPFCWQYTAVNEVVAHMWHAVYVKCETNDCISINLRPRMLSCDALA